LLVRAEEKSFKAVHPQPGLFVFFIKSAKQTDFHLYLFLRPTDRNQNFKHVCAQSVHARVTLQRRSIFVPFSVLAVCRLITYKKEETDYQFRIIKAENILIAFNEKNSAVLMMIFDYFSIADAEKYHPPRLALG
jgi:hypothetical protein